MIVVASQEFMRIQYERKDFQRFFVAWSGPCRYGAAQAGEVQPAGHTVTHGHHD